MISPRSTCKKEKDPGFELTFSPDRAPATWSPLHRAWRERKAAASPSRPALARRKQPYLTNPGLAFLQGEISRDARITSGVAQGVQKGFVLIGWAGTWRWRGAVPVGYAHLTVPGAGVGGVRGGSGMGRIRVGSDGVWRVRWGKGGGEWGMGVGCYEGGGEGEGRGL